MNQDRERLQDILEAIEKIERYTDQGRTAFDRDELIQTWIIYHIQVIGDASRRLSASLHSTYPEIPWSQIVGMRNILVHDYFGIDLAEVWSTAVRDIPKFKQQTTNNRPSRKSVDLPISNRAVIMTIGIWQSIPQPMISRYLGLMGWDWIILDLQHGAMNWETAYECIHAVRATGARPLARTAIGNPGEVEKALDLGAGGIADLKAD